MPSTLAWFASQVMALGIGSCGSPDRCLIELILAVLRCVWPGC